MIKVEILTRNVEYFVFFVTRIEKNGRLCDPVRSCLLPTWVFHFFELQGSPPLDELRAMICRKWRGSEKEKKKKKKIGAARHELYTDGNRE